jgi:hypothetical protein
MQTCIPDNWKDIKINDRILFINTKENILCFHPPFHFNNMQLFLDLYQFNVKKEDLINSITHKLENSKAKNIQVLNNVSLNQSSTSLKRNSDNHDIEPITESKFI